MISDTVVLLPNSPQTGDLPVGWATAALAMATVILASLNWSMITQMKRAPKASERPALFLWSVPVSVDDRSFEEVVLNIQNGGKGPVEEVKVECWLKKKTDGYAYLLYDSAASFASGETRSVGCHASSDRVEPPRQGDLVVRLRWRGARPWWNKWQDSEARVFHVDEMKMHGTKFRSDKVTLA